MGSPFAPNEVPAPVCAAAFSGSLTESVRSWHGITFRRLMQDSRYSMKKAGRSADTTSGFFQALEQHFEVVQSTTENKFWRFTQLHKILFGEKKNTAHAAQRWFCRVNRRQNESGVLRGGKFFRRLFLTEVVGLTVITNHFLWQRSKWTRPHLVDGFGPIHKISGICDRKYHSF